MSDFTAGLSARHDAAAGALQRTLADRPIGFAPADLIARITTAFASADEPTAPKHFHPADRDANPTEGWDPLDPMPVTTPFIDPVAAAHAAGYDEGFAAATAASAEASARDREFLAKLVEELREGGRIDRDRIARQLRQTVLHFVTRLVGDIGIAPDLLVARVTAAADLLADSSESAMLRVHPDDVALLDGKLPQTIFAVGDASVTRGSFVLEAASTIVEDGPDLWLEQLAAVIDRIEVPKTC